MYGRNKILFSNNYREKINNYQRILKLNLNFVKFKRIIFTILMNRNGNLFLYLKVRFFKI